MVIISIDRSKTIWKEYKEYGALFFFSNSCPKINLNGVNTSTDIYMESSKLEMLVMQMVCSFELICLQAQASYLVRLSIAVTGNKSKKVSGL